MDEEIALQGNRGAVHSQTFDLRFFNRNDSAAWKPGRIGIHLFPIQNDGTQENNSQFPSFAYNNYRILPGNDVVSPSISPAREACIVVGSTLPAAQGWPRNTLVQ